MPFKTKWPIVCAVLCAGTALFFFCARDYNPFTDLTNAKAHILSWSFSGSDSVQVYSTGTLQIGVAARDEVDSFCLHATRNRFWQDTTVRRKPQAALLDASAYSFNVSFFDTGVQTVTVTTWRSAGESVTESISARVKFPLDQADVTNFFGDSIRLYTPPVHDKDVFYQWKFGPDRVVKSPKNSASAVFFNGMASGAGMVWVSDLEGLHATPLSVFSYSLFDTTRPIILCANTNVQNDTLVTSDTALAFMAYIADYGDITVDSCSVNGSAFDIANRKTHLYIKKFHGMPTYTRQSALSITVFAKDYSVQTRQSRRTFWAVFDPSGPLVPGANIAFIVPTEDSSTSGTRDFRIFGTAENFLGDSMTMRVIVNDSLYAAPCAIAGGSGTWTWPVHLGLYVNSITVHAYSGTGSLPMASTHVVIAYDPTAQDMIKPLIWNISMVGDSLGKMITQQDSAALVVTAFDEWSGIQAMSINNTAATPDSSGYIWRQTISSLAHSPAGSTIDIRAIDRSQNVKDTSIVIFRNTAPVLASSFAFPASFCVDSTYTIRIQTFDADNDTVIVKGVSMPASMTVSPAGVVSWTPAASDVGTGTLAVTLSDGYSNSALYVWKFSCVDCSRPVAAVRFTTPESAFPAVLQAGVDTLRIMLQTDSAETGLRFSAKFTDRTGVILASDTSSMLVWAPVSADTGFRTLMVTVGIGTTVFDTITPVFTVVPKNEKPCSLSYTFTGDTTVAGQLDLFTHQKAETLFFAIHDQDNPLTEKYAVTITQRSATSVETLNKKDFFIVIRPDSTRTMDTIRVYIRDMTATTDSATFIIKYSTPTTNPYISWQHSQSLVLNTTPSGADVAGSVLDFPVLVRLTNSNFNFSQAAPNGEDIRFAKPDGTPCSYQIERWNPAEQGGAEIWVKVDTVYGNNGAQSITMYWGASAGSATVSLSNGAATFDTSDGFQAVWHLGGTGSGPVIDATGNQYNGVGTALSSGAMTQGIVGQCQRFNGTNSFVTMPGTAASKLNFPEKGVYSVSAWAYDNAQDNGFHTMASKGDLQYNLQIRSQSNEWQFSECMAATVYTLVRSPASAGSWNLITGIRNGDRQYLYVNGVCTDSIIETTIAGAARSTADDFVIGKMPGYSMYFFNGMIDEVRVTSFAPDGNYAKLCYMNQKAVDALVVFR
jgi:hypothetical protein